MTENIKDIYLHDEMRASVKLIELGFGEYQNLDMSNDFYHLPFQLLSSGFERLMKCHICLGYHEQHGKYPDSKFLKSCGGKNGHDLVELKKTILSHYFKMHNISALQQDYIFISDNDDLNQLIYLLSEFGKYARYYNLDIITSASKPSIDVKQLWEEYESKLVASNPETFNKLGILEECNNVLNYPKRQILISLEKFIRAICRQHTVGKLGEKAMQYSGVLHQFILINDDELGNRNYRTETGLYKKKKRKTPPRTIWDKIHRAVNRNYRHTVIKKKDYDGDWPFYHDQVTIECRYKNWCVVTIDNKDYALNGCAQGRYNLENVHESGMAVLGKNVGPFTEMALKLGMG